MKMNDPFSIFGRMQRFMAIPIKSFEGLEYIEVLYNTGRVYRWDLMSKPPHNAPCCEWGLLGYYVTIYYLF